MEHLTEKEEKFCRYYAETGNGTQSYIKAGYKAKNDKVAGVCAIRLLGKVRIKERIEQIAEQIADKKILKPREIQQFLSEVVQNAEERTNDKLKACDLLARIKGMMIERREVSGSMNISVTIEDLDGGDDGSAAD